MIFYMNNNQLVCLSVYSSADLLPINLPFQPTMILQYSWLTNPRPGLQPGFKLVNRRKKVPLLHKQTSILNIKFSFKKINTHESTKEIFHLK